MTASQLPLLDWRPARAWLVLMPPAKEAAPETEATSDTIAIVYEMVTPPGYAGPRLFVPRAVVRQTATHVYVDAGPEPGTPEARKWQLDKLRERCGGAPKKKRPKCTRIEIKHLRMHRAPFIAGRVGARYFVLLPPASPALRALGLDDKATAEDVRRAYRNRARVAHPDAGGDGESFVRLTRNYREAMRAVGGAA